MNSSSSSSLPFYFSASSFCYLHLRARLRLSLFFSLVCSASSMHVIKSVICSSLTIPKYNSCSFYLDFVFVLAVARCVCFFGINTSVRRLIFHIHARRDNDGIKVAILHQCNNKVLNCNLSTCRSVCKNLMPCVSTTKSKR